MELRGSCCPKEGRSRDKTKREGEQGDRPPVRDGLSLWVKGGSSQCFVSRNTGERCKYLELREEAVGAPCGRKLVLPKASPPFCLDYKDSLNELHYFFFTMRTNKFPCGATDWLALSQCTEVVIRSDSSAGRGKASRLGVGRRSKPRRCSHNTLSRTGW